MHILNKKKKSKKRIAKVDYSRIKVHEEENIH